MGVHGQAITDKINNRHPIKPPAQKIDPTYLRAEIARLDQEASILRNRSQITERTRARIDALIRESAVLSAQLTESSDARQTRASLNEIHRAQFDHGHGLYLKHQAAALTQAHGALCALTQCMLPPALERTIISLIADLDRHDSRMRTYSPAQGIPASMKRLKLCCK